MSREGLLGGLRNRWLAALSVLVVSSLVWAAPKYTVLHAFGSAGDGSELNGSVALDKKGNLYGTTLGGGQTSTA